MRRRRAIAAPLLALASLGCTVDEVPSGLKATPPGDGPVVRYDVFHRPLPEIPMPNDAAMWPDPTSRTGLRINASLVAPTRIEAVARQKFSTLEGWGTYSPISVAFDRKQAKAQNVTPATSAVDLEVVRQRHQKDDYELRDDVLYLVNLDTGVPVPLDLGEGSFQYVTRDKNRYWVNDTRSSEANLLFETADETVSPSTGQADPARTEYKPEYDTDFDGVLDRPNLFNSSGCMNQVRLAALLADPATTDDERQNLEAQRDSCLTDGLLSWYERETDTLIARPLIPLAEKTRYAVVITDRLVDPQGNPARSPFDFVYHPSQEAGISRLSQHLSSPELASYYGDIGGTGLEHVAFAWTFTTQPIVEDLRTLRDGLYGAGKFQDLARRFPARAEISRAVGLATDEEGWESRPECARVIDEFRIGRFEVVKPILQQLASVALGIEGPQLTELGASWEAISHIAVGSFRSPFFLEGGRKNEDPNASFAVDFEAGDAEVHEDTVQFIVTVPKETEQSKQPFPVVYYGHGYTGLTFEALGFAGQHARQGLATVSMNAVYHGVALPPEAASLIGTFFGSICAVPLANAVLDARARDLNHDGAVESGGDYWTAYLFHTRDVVRQTAIDALQLFRILKTFDGTTLAPRQSARGDEPTLAGDFDGNGVPDVGGPRADYGVWGQSLGGILAPLIAALDPDIVSVAPGSGAAGLMDVGIRTTNGGAFEGIYLRELGPLLVGVPAADLGQDTACEPNEVSLRMIAVDVNAEAQVEFHCFDPAEATGGRSMPNGGTVIVFNGKNGEERCVRMDKSGAFRTGIPSSQGDKLEVQIWDEPDVVSTYHPEGDCPVTVGQEHRVALINTWQNEGKFQDRVYPAGSPLVAVAEGLGFVRQTPQMRRFGALSAHVVDAADPVNFAPYFALRTIKDPFGRPHPPTGMLNFITLGDINVPVNAGVAIARAAGAVPFLVPGAETRYPAYADYVTPAALYEALRNKTPNRVLIDNHVLEGVARLMRHRPAGECAPNEVPVGPEPSACHPPCDCPDGQRCGGCYAEQVCIQQRCIKAPVSAIECAQSLVDPDVFDEGTARYGEVELPVPLRLTRIAAPATPATIDAVWEPRLAGEPYSDDASGWQANARVLAQAHIYVRREGEHGIYVSDPCLSHNDGLYGVNLVSRFVTSQGTDVYYVSHPETHMCLAEPPGPNACPFVAER